MADGRVSPAALADVTLVGAVGTRIRVYPNPWRANRDAGRDVTFADLPENATVKIFTVAGHLVKEIQATGTTAQWNRKTDSGDRAASGLYFYLIEGQKTRGRLVLID
jgi:hypothetical protein